MIPPAIAPPVINTVQKIEYCAYRKTDDDWRRRARKLGIPLSIIERSRSYKETFGLLKLTVLRMENKRKIMGEK